MSGLGRKLTVRLVRLMSALPPKADIDGECLDVRFANSRHSDRFWILLIVGKGAQIRGASPVKLPRREFLHLTAGTFRLGAGLSVAAGAHRRRLSPWYLTSLRG
jgi:hypothetical protein